MTCVSGGEGSPQKADVERRMNGRNCETASDAGRASSGQPVQHAEQESTQGPANLEDERESKHGVGDVLFQWAYPLQLPN